MNGYYIRFLQVVFILFLLSDISCAASGQAERYLEQARLYVNKNKPKIAEQILDEGIKKYPREISLYFERGKIRDGKLKKYAWALLDYTIVLKYGHNVSPKVFYRRGDVYFKLSQYAEAIKDYSSCLKVFHKYGKVYFKRAKAYLKLGNRSEALLDLQRTIHFSPIYESEVNAFREKNLL
jgi:tetratricopeptide (TPR) repeat protein